jgi:hypothetical protein
MWRLLFASLGYHRSSYDLERKGEGHSSHSTNSTILLIANITLSKDVYYGIENYTGNVETKMHQLFQTDDVNFGYVFRNWGGKALDFYMINPTWSSTEWWYYELGPHGDPRLWWDSNYVWEIGPQDCRLLIV